MDYFNNVTCTAVLDYFGPSLDDHFDFTLTFEQSILSVLPSALLLAVSPFRIAWLFRKATCARSGWLLWTKLATVVIFLTLQVALVAQWGMPSTSRTRVSLAAAVLALVGSFTIAILVYAEHRRSVKPSTLLVAYLATSLLLDVAQARSLFLWHLSGYAVLAGLFVTALGTKFALLILEEVPKRSVLTGNLKTTALESTSGPINRSVFWWINELFAKGFRNVLKVGDLDAIDDSLASKRLLARLGPAWKKSDKSAKHSLLVSTWSSFQAAFLLPVLPRLCLAGFKFAQPFLVNRVISFVGESNNTESRGIAGGLIGATALVYIGLAISRSLYNHFVYRLITTLRGCLVSLIFEKTTQLSAKAAKNEAATTLMSTDIDGIASGIKDMHEIWANVVELGVAVYLLSRQIGSACFLAVIPAVVCSFVTERATEGIGPARGQWNGGVQKRVSATSSMLAQMKGLKMMGLSDYMSSLIQCLRVAELNLSKKFKMFIVRIIMISNFSDQMTPAVVVVAAAFWTRAGPGGFTVSEAFTALSVVALVSTPVANLMGSYPNFVSSLACFDRIQKFLLSDKHIDDKAIESSPCTEYRSASFDVVFAARTFRNLESDDTDLELQNLSSTRLPTSIASVSVEFASATFTLEGKIEPILRGISLSLEKSSLTMIIGPVGSGKSSLLKAILGELPPSTGTVRVEQAGMSIAYCDQTPWLRNISVRENIVGQSAFDQDYYTAVLQACDLKQEISHFTMGDETLVGSGGIALSGGQKSRLTLARAIYARKQITLLDDVFSALDTATSRHLFEGIIGPKGLLRKNGMTTVLASNTVHHLPFADHIIVLDKTGDIIQRGGFAELQFQDGYVKDLALQAYSAPANREERPLIVEATNKKVSSMPVEDPAWQRQTGDFSLYKFYFRSIGAPLAMSFLCLAVGYIFMGKLPEIWVRVWTEHGTTTDKGAYAGAYIAFCLATVLLSGFAVGFFMVVVIPKSAAQLHWLLLEAVVDAPLWFFTTTDNGATLNRFSQDMTLVDQALPMAFFETTFDSLDVIAATALIASGAQYVAAVIPLCIVPLFFLQKVYLKTSRQLRHLDLEAKSPLYTQFSETLNGVVTIRAFGWETAFTDENLRLLDLSQKPYYLLFCIQRWLGVVMDLFVAGIAVVLVAFAVQFTHTTSRGAIGLAMINIIGFNNSLSRLISSWTSLETSLGAISRLRNFVRDTPKEESVKGLPAPPANWPSMGAISLSNVTATYHSNDETILHNFSISISRGTKVGICGRTGSGKSSLLLTILRLLETNSGSISIDDLPLSSLPRNALRSRITTLPQDPIMLPGTIRDNLDPHSRCCSSDEGIISKLQKVLLWELIDGRGGLDANFDTLELSHGQQQLFSLARAILDKKKVVLLDEATSNVDMQTDRVIQEVIREEFKDCTVLTVAHRLETIGDMDMVIVIDQGRIVEVGDPKVLRDQHVSHFGSLWENRH